MSLRLVRHRPPRRPKRWLSPYGWGEVRLAMLGGVLLGLVFSAIPDGSVARCGMAAPEGQFATGPVRVIDGDTFDQGGVRIRIADIDTPEMEARCSEEARLAAAAARRLRSLLAAGPFELRPIDRDEDVYGRKLRIVTRDGRSIGDTMVAEGLAQYYEGGRRSWCG